jgi:ribonuclease HII
MSAYEPPSLERIEVACDEAGRGCLYGDVVAAAVILPPYEPWMDQLKDSKQISAKRRESLAILIKEQAVAYGIGTASAQEIDRMNILRATLKAMHRALDQVAEKIAFEHILVDGPHFRPYSYKEEDGEPVYIPYTCIAGGDGIKMGIAAASILAKTHRDQWVIQQVQEDPTLEKYGLVSHKGYGTLKHMMALQLYGPDKNHRMSFAPVTANMR